MLCRLAIISWFQVSDPFPCGQEYPRFVVKSNAEIDSLEKILGLQQAKNTKSKGLNKKIQSFAKFAQFVAVATLLLIFWTVNINFGCDLTDHSICDFGDTEVIGVACSTSLWSAGILRSEAS